MTTYILNSPVLTAFGKYTYKPLTVEEARDWVLAADELISAIGHESTAKFLSTLLNIEIPANRVRITMKPGDVAVVFRVLQRLPEGFVATEEELRSIPWELGLLIREE